MLSLYSPRKVEKLLQKEAGWINTLSRRYAIPAAYIHAMLYKEISGIDIFDFFADSLVGFFWARYRLRRWACRRGFLRRAGPAVKNGPFGKHDSSTGYAQIFAWVGINAIRFAAEKGLADPAELGFPGGRLPEVQNWNDLCLVWRRLRGDRRYNLEIGTLNLLAAAWEMNGHADFARYTPEEAKRMFTRYNANVRHITPYGEETYRYAAGWLAKTNNTGSEAV